jgi:nuclear transport factor 2 (NTF2) superfamily protein
MTGRPPFPPFTLETARQKVQAVEDGWNINDLAISAADRRIFGTRPESERGADFPLR